MTCNDYGDYKKNIECVVKRHETGSKIYDIETDLFNKINEFNHMYSCYIRTTYNSVYTNRESLPVDDCNGIPVSDASINELYNDIVVLVEEVNDFVKSSDGSKYSMDAVNELDETNTKLRQDIESKMNEIKGGPGSITQENQSQLDATVYASLLWTTLATGLLYYVAVEM